MKRERVRRSAIFLRETSMEIGIFAINRLNYGINSRRRFPQEHTCVSIRCWIGRRSIFGSTSNTKIFLLWIFIWTEAMARVIEVSAVRPAQCLSDQRPKQWTISSRNYDIRMWRNEPGGRRMKVAAWSCCAKMDTCKQSD